jgi:hypothetical protein
MTRSTQQRAKFPIALVKPSVNLDNNNCNRTTKLQLLSTPWWEIENGILIVCSASELYATAELSYQHTSRLDNGMVEMARPLT